MLGPYVLVSAFPPATTSLSEYGFHFAKAFAARPEVSQLIVLADRQDDITEELPTKLPIRVERVWDFNDSASAFRILRRLRQIKPAGVIFNLQTASFGDREIPAALGMMAPMISRMLGIPTGVIAHNIVDAVDLEQTQFSGQAFRQLMIRTAAKVVTRVMCKANYVTVTLDSFADILRDRYGLDNVYMVPHGTFEPKDGTPPPVDQRPMAIVTMGKFGTYKRLERSIEATRRLRTRPEFSSLRLIIGGADHPATPGYLAGLKEKLGPDSGVEFFGYVPEDSVSDFFRSGRLSVFDYDSTTGSSGVLHQAAVHGTPSVYPLIGDFVDVTEKEGLSGFHFKHTDVDSLEQTIADALSAPDDCQRVLEENYKAAMGLRMPVIAAVHRQLLARAQMKRRFLLRTSEFLPAID